MASMYTNLNINAFNRKQVVQAAKNTGVLTPTSGNHTLDKSTASLLTAVKAK